MPRTINIFARFSVGARDWLLVLLTPLLLILAFPKTDVWILSWFALIPLFISLNNAQKFSDAVLKAYVSGFVFFLGTLYWFIHVTLPGMILMVAYAAVYFGVFGAVCWRARRYSFLKRLFFLPSAWVLLEFARAHLLTGFGWAALGYSQYKNILMIQIADLTGVYGVTFVIVLVNTWLQEIVRQRVFAKKLNAGKEFVFAGLIVVGILAAVIGYGFWSQQDPTPADQSRIAVIQGSIPLELKWNKSAWPLILEKYLLLTQKAAAEKPDLIIWPETAFPGFIWEVPEDMEKIKGFVAEKKIPLLLGLVTMESGKYYNSALLLADTGEAKEQYDKIHLVPFGEFIPFRGSFSFLRDVIPIDDFTAGSRFTLFPVEASLGPKVLRYKKFGVLICFEDSVEDIARQFAQEGAHMFVNITNDAWFKDTKAPFMHLSSSVFRAVENRRPVVRSANTGVSCFIDSRGRVKSYLQDKMGKKTFVAGYTVGNVELRFDETVYTKFGDIFTYLCFGCILWIVLIKRK